MRYLVAFPWLCVPLALRFCVLFGRYWTQVGPNFARWFCHEDRQRLSSRLRNANLRDELRFLELLKYFDDLRISTHIVNTHMVHVLPMQLVSNSRIRIGFQLLQEVLFVFGDGAGVHNFSECLKTR